MDTHSSSQRLQELKDSRKPFPLESLLTIYCKAKPVDVYINDFEGLRLLVNWLSPIEHKAAIVQRIPDIFMTYEIQQIAKLLNLSPDYIYHILWNIHHGFKTQQDRTEHISEMAEYALTTFIPN